MNGERDLWVLLGNGVAVVPVYDQALPYDDRVDDTTISQDVGFELVQLLKSERRDLALKFRVNLKRIQIHHQTVPS